MAEMTPQVSELLEKALTLSAQERGWLIDRLVETLDNGPAEEGVEAAWEEEIKRRVDDIRSGRVKTIPGEQVLRELAEEFPDGDAEAAWQQEVVRRMEEIESGKVQPAPWLEVKRGAREMFQPKYHPTHLRGDQNPRPVPANNAETRTGHPL